MKALLTFVWKTLVVATSLVPLGLLMAGLAGDQHWRLALINAAQVTIACTALAGIGLCWLSGLKRWAVFGLCFVAGVILMSPPPPQVQPRPSHCDEARREFRAVWGNMHLNPQALDALSLQDHARTSSLIGLAEVPADTDLARLFPAAEAASRRTSGQTWGVEVAGCTRLAAGNTLRSPRGRDIALKARCDGFTFFALHLSNPTRWSGRGLAYRNREMAAVAAAIAATSGPVVVMGDFNAPPHARALTQFAKTAGVKHVACGGPLAITWRPGRLQGSRLDGFPLLGLPIDHVFVRDVQPTSCRVGPDTGSDHYPLYLSFLRPVAGA